MNRITARLSLLHKEQPDIPAKQAFPPLIDVAGGAVVEGILECHVTLVAALSTRSGRRRDHHRIFQDCDPFCQFFEGRDALPYFAFEVGYALFDTIDAADAGSEGFQ